MEGEAVTLLAVLAVVLVALVRDLAAPARIMLGGLAALVVLGVLPVHRALDGFWNPATLTIAGMFVVAQTLRDHLQPERALARLLGDGGQPLRRVLVRLLLPITLLSSVMNNTPLVATSAPIVREWAERHDVAHSRLLVPVSFAAILGGVLTTIGTTTNLVVSGLLQSAGRPPLGFFTITPVALPVVVLGLAIVVVLAPSLLPDRRVPEPDVVTRRAVSAGPPPRSWRATPDAVAPVTPSQLDSSPWRDHRRVLTVVTALAMVGVAATGFLPLVTTVLVACGVLVLVGATSPRRALAALDVDVLLIVSAAIGFGLAAQISGLADVLADGIQRLGGSSHALVGLAVLVGGTVLLTEVVTNVAAAAMMVPIALDLAERVGADPRGYAVAVAVAASASFLTPIGYQTNTIVYRLGGYRFGDYWRLGLPVTVTAVVSAVVMTPLVWA